MVSHISDGQEVRCRESRRPDHEARERNFGLVDGKSSQRVGSAALRPVGAGYGACARGAGSDSRG